MSDYLNEDDIEMFMGLPMSSELDPEIVSDGGWGSNVESNADDTDNDPDFAPTDGSMSVSEDDDPTAIDVDVNNSVNASVNTSEIENERMNEGEIEEETLNEALNESDVSEGMEDEEYVSLNDKYKNLNQRDKIKMKKEEETKWQLFVGMQKCFDFDGNSEFKFNLPRDAEPVEYFNTYLTNEILLLMVEETNRNAAQVIAKIRLNRSSRLRQWRPTTIEEIKKFIGLLLYMGLGPLPRISDYWSKKTLYMNFVAGKVMSRNRFQLLIRFWHFNDNEMMAQEGRLAKIAPLVSYLNQVFKTKKTPGQDVVVDESMIPFRGRLLFRQYLPNKTHKYGITIFKICDTTGYTFKMIVYMGKGTGTDDGMTLASSVVMDLMRDYLDKGHVLYIDNFYTSVDLSSMLLSRKTHTVGTVISNRAWFPHKKTLPDNQKLKVGEMSCLEYPNGIVYTRWMDKREVKLMSTKHQVQFVNTGMRTRQGEEIQKPLVVAEYNKAKMGIDLSDQMSSYSSAVRKSMRWYHKVAEELLLGTAVVNAWLAYKENVGANAQRRRVNTYSITSFREKSPYLCWA